MIQLDDKGLVSAIVQDDDTGRVLMLGYMNPDALERTLGGENVWFYSRSRSELWLKGETSGNFLKVKSLHLDCDGDAILVKADPIGPTCHTGEQSCFFIPLTDMTEVATRDRGPGITDELFALIQSRKDEMPEGSYTTALFEQGAPRIAQKVIEEAGETAIAGVTGDPDALAAEAADMIYHTLVLLAAEGITPEDVWAETAGAEKVGGPLLRMAQKVSAKDITLSVVDQSPMRKGSTAAESLRETVALAVEAESCGYKRYWVAEHHNSTSFTGNSPEILIGQIAANTSSIRVGSGGVMLPHYSALKVAEQFRTLNAFYPGRIDLGIGRAPGSDQRTALALTYPRPPTDVNRFPQMVSDLLAFLEDEISDDHPFSGIVAQAGPMPDEVPDVWLLGSSDFSARLAGLLGLPFAFADFFGTTGEYGPAVAELYREQFKPSKYLPEPRVNVTVQALCAPTDEEAQFIASSRNLSKAGQHLNLKGGLLPPEEASVYPITEIARQYIESLKPAYVDGTPERVRDRIVSIASDYGTTDVGVVTNCYNFEHRVRSYRLIAEAFEIG